MSRQRDRDRSSSALPKPRQLPRVTYEEVAQATYGTSESEILNQWFGDLSPTSASANDVAIAADGSLVAFNYRLTGIGLDPTALSSQRANWEQLGQLLFRFDRSMQWLIGDWLLHGEHNNWGKHEDIAAELGLDVKTLYDYRYVARHVEFSVRTEKLSFGHHKLVAQLEPSAQRHWLEKAVAGDFDAVAGLNAVLVDQAPAPGNGGAARCCASRRNALRTQPAPDRPRNDPPKMEPPFR